MQLLLFVVLGLVAGGISGLVGLGGGIIVVPALVYLFHFSQKDAQGTTLALLLPPIGIFAVMAYQKAGHVNFKVAALLALGFVLGSFFTARLAPHISNTLLTRMFGGFLLLIAIKMLFNK
jgi:uncharacterized membrane protein YfcA